MGHKIFVSYKYADKDVNHIAGEWYEENTVRNYVDKLEEYLSDISDHIYKGESDGEDLSKLTEETIWEKLKSRIYDSTLTIVMISKNMKTWEADKEQWIPREISYSLKEISRTDKSGNEVASKTNAVLAVIVPDSNNSYSYYTYKKTCCDSGCRVQLTNKLFDILKNNMFNVKEKDTNDCSDGSKVYYGDCSYITCVKWDDFINDVDSYIDKAYELQDNIENYEICKEV